MPYTKPIGVALHRPRLTETVNPFATLLSRLLLFDWIILYWATLHGYAQLLQPPRTLRPPLTGMRPILDQGRRVASKVPKRSSVFHNALFLGSLRGPKSPQLILPLLGGGDGDASDHALALTVV